MLEKKNTNQTILQSSSLGNIMYVRKKKRYKNHIQNTPYT